MTMHICLLTLGCRIGASFLFSRLLAFAGLRLTRAQERQRETDFSWDKRGPYIEGETIPQTVEARFREAAE